MIRTSARRALVQPIGPSLEGIAAASPGRLWKAIISSEDRAPIACSVLRCRLKPRISALVPKQFVLVGSVGIAQLTGRKGSRARGLQ